MLDAVMDMMSLWVTGGWESVIMQRESSDHGAILSVSARFLTIMEIQLTVLTLLPRTPYLDSVSVPPRFLPGI